MTQKSANSCSARNLLALSSAKGLARCLHRYPSGRRCRFPLADTSSYFCEHHVHLRPPTPDSADLSPDLAGNLSEFTSAADINQVLSKLLILLSQNRVSPRRAAVIAYVTSLLLRTLPAIEQELRPDSGDGAAETTFLWDLPRPDRTEPVVQTR